MPRTRRITAATGLAMLALASCGGGGRPSTVLPAQPAGRPVPTSVYTKVMTATVASANLTATAGAGATGDANTLDWVEGEGVKVDVTMGTGRAVVNLGGRGYSDDQGGADRLRPLRGADGLTVRQLQAALRVDLGGAVEVRQDTPGLWEVVYSHDPVTSLASQVQRAVRAPGTFPSTVQGGRTTAGVQTSNGRIVSVYDENGQSLTLDYGQGDLPTVCATAGGGSCASLGDAARHLVSMPRVRGGW